MAGKGYDAGAGAGAAGGQTAIISRAICCRVT
jgi:hypothetical protein